MAHGTGHDTYLHNATRRLQEPTSSSDCARHTTPGAKLAVVTKVRKSLSPLLLLLASTVVALPCIANSDINFCSCDNFDTKGRLESHAMIADFCID